mgnify:CR=1 FL=1
MQNYIRFQVLNFIQETTNTTTIVLKSLSDKPKTFLPGQFLTLFVDSNGDEVRFTYSITSLPQELPIIRITIKNNTNRQSSLLNFIKPGDTIKSIIPLGTFTITNVEEQKNYFFFGAGSGITPLFPMIKDTLLNNCESNVFLFYGNKDESDIIFHKELEQLEAEFQNRFRVNYFLSQSLKNNSYKKGRISKEVVIEQLAVYNKSLTENADYFVCGPEGMMRSVIEGLKDIKIDSKRIHFEEFSLNVIDYDGEIELKDRDVIILLLGERYKIKVEAGKTILQKAIEENISIPNSCNYGSCGTCIAKLISGDVMLGSQSAINDNQKENGICLTCVGYPVSDNVVVLYENPFEE